jgi:hypothetical protein
LFCIPIIKYAFSSGIMIKNKSIKLKEKLFIKKLDEPTNIKNDNKKMINQKFRLYDSRKINCNSFLIIINSTIVIFLIGFVIKKFF